MFTVHANSSATTQRLWQICSDVTRWPEWLPHFSAVEPLGGEGTIGVGSRFLVRQPGLPDATYEVTSWRPGHGFVWVARKAVVTTTATHEVVSQADGSRIELGLGFEGSVGWLVGLTTGRTVRRMIRQEADAFAALAQEAGPAGSAAP